VFSAHYDHLGGLGKESYFAGANDNASGITLLLELLEHYKANPVPYSIVFMFFGAEEAGLIGSKFYVENPLFALSKIKFLTNLDLVGTGIEGITVVNATIFPKEFALIESLNKAGNYFPQVKKRGKAANSDHYFFTEKGVKSFFIYAMGGIQAYHDVDDRAETLPLSHYEAFFKLLTGFVGQMK
jgi:aminopeptidase YwaD